MLVKNFSLKSSQLKNKNKNGERSIFFFYFLLLMIYDAVCCFCWPEPKWDFGWNFKAIFRFFSSFWEENFFSKKKKFLRKPWKKKKIFKRKKFFLTRNSRKAKNESRFLTKRLLALWNKIYKSWKRLFCVIFLYI